MCHIPTQSWLTPPKNVLSGVNEVQWGKIKSTKASGVAQLHAEGSQSRFRNPMPFYLHNNFTNETPELMLHFCMSINRSQWQCKLPSCELGATYLHHFHRVALWSQAKKISFSKEKVPKKHISTLSLACIEQILHLYQLTFINVEFYPEKPKSLVQTRAIWLSTEKATTMKKKNKSCSNPASQKGNASSTPGW